MTTTKTQQETIYEKNLDKVIAGERVYIANRRLTIAEEFRKIHKNRSQWYADLLGKEREAVVGLAFSGGGIRSATFNLGIAQGLSKFGILPWVDYLSSVSGGGYIAGCMNSLLTYEEKKLDLNEKEIDQRRYYPFNTHWQRFPFNPGLQVFDATGVAYQQPVFNENTLNPKFKPANKAEEKLFESLQSSKVEEIHIDLKESDNQNRNRQLEHLRKLGDYLIPRMGPFTLNTMRGVVGALLLRIAYTLWIYLLIVAFIGLTHYAITAAFTPEIRQDFNFAELATQTTSPVDQTSNAAAREDTSSSIAKMFNLAFVSYKDQTAEYPKVEYGIVLLFGVLHIWMTITLVSLCYRKDVTTDNRLMDWQSPNKHISLYAWLVIRSIRIVFFALGLIILPVLSVWLVYQQWQIQTLSAEQFNLLIATAFLFAIYFIFAIGFLVTSGNEEWAQQGLPENEFIDEQVSRAFILLTLWVMTLILSALRFASFPDNGSLNLYWLWMPSVFAFGGMLGLAIFQATQILQNSFLFKWMYSKRVFSKKNSRYDDKSVGGFMRWYLKTLGVKDNRDLPDRPRAQSLVHEVLIRKSRGVAYTFKIWASPEFRSTFWTFQGILFYGFIGFAALGLIALPNYFVGVSGAQSMTAIPLSVTLLSALWAYLKSSGKGAQITEWVSKIFALPEELMQGLLALLVIALNLSILFLFESLMDYWLGSWSFTRLGFLILGVLLTFVVTGYLVNANYLSAHYFYRDRLGEAYFQTSVDDHQGRLIRVVRDDRARRMSRTLNPQCSAPYHLVVTALNMSGSWHLEYKDRKSQPFIFSREYCGSEITGYVTTKKYRGDNTKYSQVIALSGAAVSSGIGYLTFFAQAFLVTLFNLRLGLWLTNPKLYDPEYQQRKGIKNVGNVEESSFWPRYLWNEARGRMSEREALVNITDGGHTGDDPGLYPLFQRRCKYIIAGDAGEDPRGTCADLFSVLRQVEVDFGIKVDINVDKLAPGEYDAEKKTATQSKSHFAIGKIHYPLPGGKEETGWLIYLHPAVVEGDPAFIEKYWERHKMEFPHPSTVDQFFNDEQFEVTRLLGEWTVESVIKEMMQEFENRQAESKKGRRSTPLPLEEHLAFIKTWIRNKNGVALFEVPKDEPTNPNLLAALPDLLEAYHGYQNEKAPA